jgi:23S rRNA (uracil1939-C5)-methyltransferase
MDLAIRRAPDGSIALGLHEAGSSAVVDFAECWVLHPTLFALLAPLRPLLRRLSLRREGSLLANLLESGPDLLLRLDAPLTAGDRAALAAFAAAHALPRIAVALNDGPPEIAAQHAPVAHRFAGVAVTPPPGAFLQATGEGEAAIVAAVLAGLPKLAGRAWIADLFAGIGTLSLPLAAHAPVRAAEGDAASAAALRQAGGIRIAVQHRDLSRRPLLGAEWSRCAVAVLDPPHAGAAVQVAEIARAKVPRIIYVSCNPATLARDAALLHAAGYRLLAATAIDQFLWSAQVESVSVFAADAGSARDPRPAFSSRA